MGNRCVITTEENYAKCGVGVYLHWNGGRDSVAAFLQYCKLKGYRAPDKDCYGWARLCQVIGNFFEGSSSVGIDTLDMLDCDNGDNGVYLTRGWEIVGRKYFTGEEQNVYDLQEMLIEIDSHMSPADRLGEDYLMAPLIEPQDMKIGDCVAFLDHDGKVVRAKVEGFGAGILNNFVDVTGVPFIARYSPQQAREHVGNYLFKNTQYRKLC